jgi:NADH:ubiquinone oxidoreductase subunit
MPGFIDIFAWWRGNSFGQAFTLWRTGAVKVGEDEFGNTYYRAKNWPPHGERRYVVYAAGADWDASRVPPGWRGWLTHTYAVPPSQQRYKPREWEKSFKPNLTGTPGAYRPQGSTLAAGERPPATGDYVAWSPDGWEPRGHDADGKSPDGRDVARPEAHPGIHGVGSKQPHHG